MNLISEARSLLETAGYETAMPDVGGSMFYFEDYSLMGFVSAHQSINDILNQWEAEQDSFLRRHAVRFSTAPTKAWNIYSVYLTASKIPPQMLSKLSEIEEDFRGTRKLVRSDIETRLDLKQALLTFLPIQNVVTVEAEDVLERLRDRLASVDRTLPDLITETSAKELAHRLLEEE